MPFSADQGAFLGFVVEAIIYGMYTVLFALALTVLLGRPNGKPINAALTIATCLLFACCTAHFGLNFSNKYKGLILEPGVVSISNETTELFADDVLFSITDFLGQCILIYRCWRLWGERYSVVALPVVLALASVACAMAGLGILFETAPTAPFAPASVAPLGTTAFALSLCLNFLVTLLIVGRIWHISQQTRILQSYTTRNRTRVAMGVLIESGMLFLAVQLVFVVLFAIGHPAQNVVVPAALQIYGIAPTLLIVRVRMGSSYDPEARESIGTIDLSRTPHGAVPIRRNVRPGLMELLSISSEENTSRKGSSAFSSVRFNNDIQNPYDHHRDRSRESSQINIELGPVAMAF
ncbi:hypothetical protein PLICRDRAFT_355567 [Plicaturopsis crispa FD-325 SS-3]|uniref:Uncharacterized protein n=1 Tax=Plicaturopsis crispa FD-325 SS-3 TaxID=944288 RepID=A0A0C9T8S5_PLICR|nr:hypothetical protein PLICRDRAFT_355567 [Plicaturopsis crispa FD-325 SS-3]